ncbi:hypothetical protein ACEWY4_015168 [Coilia grayii]|uniref:Uncharacterized protein n=1 Tax=Coilia grayii TaxID=363190 RepID=A0ABD1JN84_9TELE
MCCSLRCSPIRTELAMLYRWLPVLGVLMDCYIENVRLCPGEQYIFGLPAWAIWSNFEKSSFLFFVKNGTEKKIADGTQSLDPSYDFHGNRPYIPQIMEKHEGEYYWKAMSIYKDLHIKLSLKECSELKKLTYGEDLTLRVPEEAVVLEFDRSSGSSPVVLWSRINAANERGARGRVSNSHWKATRMTPADSGRFSFLMESGKAISRTVVTVVDRKEYAHVNDFSSTHRFVVDVAIPLLEVEVTCLTESDGKHVLFQKGLETDEGFSIFGGRMQLQATDTGSTFSINSVQSSDAGVYEIRDNNGHLAVTIHLTRDKEFDPKTLIAPISITLGVLLGLTCCCWCCCKLCRDDGDKAESTAASPDAEQPIYVHDPLEMSGSGDPLQNRNSAPSSDNTNQLQATGAYPSNPWANSPPPFFPSGAADSSYGPVAHAESHVPDPVSSPHQSPAPFAPYQPHVPDPVSSPHQSPAPFAPYQVPSEARAGGGAEGGGVGGGDSNAPTVPLHLRPQYQPRSWGGGLDDFLSSSPLCLDSSTKEGATYTSDKLNF